jgi:DNA-binding CsgD family transcriptional regulator
VARRNAAPEGRGLSRREREVMALAAQGHANKFIGYELGIAPSTVAMHLGRGMRKLGIGSRLELVVLLGRGT